MAWTSWARGASLALFLASCSSEGALEFSYSILFVEDNNAARAAFSCEEADLAVLRLLIGDDENGDALLQDGEVTASRTLACNQENVNEDNVLELSEIGAFGPAFFPPGEFSLFAVELLDPTGALLVWTPSLDLPPGERASFALVDPLTLNPGQSTRLTFTPDDSGVPQLNQELQIFLAR